MTSLLRSTVSPETIGFHLVVTALTMIIVGGRAVLGRRRASARSSSPGCPSLLQFVGEWQPLVYGILVAFAAVYVPNGLLGVLQQAWRRTQARRRRVPAEGAGARRHRTTADPEHARGSLPTGGGAP